MQKIRVVPTLVILGVSLSVLFGGWIGYRDYGLVGPVERQLKEQPQVQSVEVKVNGTNREVEVALGEVPDLQKSYAAIQQSVEDKMGPQVQLSIKDHRSDDLSNLYRSYQPLIFEGVAKGTYSEMIQQVTQQAHKDGISQVRLTMDRNHLYVQLQKGKDYLYDVVPYSVHSGQNGQEVGQL